MVKNSTAFGSLITYDEDSDCLKVPDPGVRGSCLWLPVKDVLQQRTGGYTVTLLIKPLPTIVLDDRLLAEKRAGGAL